MASILRIFHILVLALKCLLVESFQFPNISMDNFQFENITVANFHYPNTNYSFQIKNNQGLSIKFPNNNITGDEFADNNIARDEFDDNIIAEDEIPGNNIGRIDQLQNNSIQSDELLYTRISSNLSLSAEDIKNITASHQMQDNNTESKQINKTTSSRIIAVTNLRASHQIAVNNKTANHIIAVNNKTANHQISVNNKTANHQISVNNETASPQITVNDTDSKHLNKTTLSLGSQIFFEGAAILLPFFLEEVLDKFEQMPVQVPAHKMNWTDYQDFGVAQKYLDILERKYSFLSTEVIGRTWEDRPLRVVKICRGACGDDQPVKPAIWVQTGIHAREWITQAVGMYLIKELVENDEEHPEMVDNLDWYILPFANPDGYQYSRTKDRSWRKNRRPLNRRPCPLRYYSYGMSMGEGLGVDLNRNFGFKYNTSDSSNDPCSQVYIGTGPFSEPETASIRDFILKHKDIVMFNDIHAYSQMIFLPWAHTKKEHPNIEEITRLANIGNTAIKETHGKIYRVGCGPCLIYKVGGDASDWAAHTPKIRYPFSMEIRGTRPIGRTGFELPSEEIIPTGQEIWAFHKAVANDIISNFNNRKIGI